MDIRQVRFEAVIESVQMPLTNILLFFNFSSVSGSKRMGLQVEIALLCIVSLVGIQHILCDGVSTNPETNKWTCTCSIAHQQNSNIVPANCSSSCDCSPAAGRSSENKWTCVCSTGGLPRLVGEDNDSGCFTSCNCNAGDLSDLEPSKKWISSKVVVIVLLLCLVLTVLAFIASVLWFVYRKHKHSVQWTSFSPDRLTSCNSATNLMSRGSSSVTVYKGSLDSSFKSYIVFVFELESATNRFSDTNLIGVGGTATSTVIELISRLHHCHVVPLLGYCSANQGKHAERLLVFEYIPNGNLRECLDGDLGQCLEWNTRITIALGAARGLEYLHDAAAPRILHRDVKSTNILLDDKWKAKITDLGMAKHLRNDGILSGSSSPARMQGTFGYFAPEYAIVGRASLKSDVFSFGVVLLELITVERPSTSHRIKAKKATPRLHDSKRVILELPDPRLKGAFQEEEMQVMAYLAKECLLLDPDSRPSMSEVVQILSTIAPNKSKRKHMPSAFQYSSAGGLISGNPETCDEEELNDTSSTEEIKQITFETPAQFSSPTNLDSNNLSVKQNEKEAYDSSTDIGKLMLLTSKSRSWRLQDDEVVDLTEPRFESFCLPNVDSV
ncbi:hypothetical protein DH2020_000028 [Rehmannia glutinosa]|uniref:Protein kinase domain-containing protein n=1 Tax=Rehmannia glutinosa TaxID=99300 RepID=A0ABR0XVM5_REHGL